MSFLDIYKEVDAFLKDAYSADTGVTYYIDLLYQMQDENWYGIEWESTYRKLRYLRHIRNQIVHDVGASEELLCKDDDVAWMENFHEKLSNSEDPISLRRKKELAAKHRNSADANSSIRNGWQKIKAFFKNLFH